MITPSPESWRSICAALRASPPADAASARAFAERYFVPYQASDKSGDNAFLTGYYAPAVRASLTPGPEYRTPIYRLPPGLASPGPSRTEIEAGALSGRGLELAWLADPVDLFFLQVQGSGTLILPDGTTLPVRFAGKTGHPYTAIGKVLIEEYGVPKDGMSMQVIAAWLRAHPVEAPAVMRRNASYVFFREGPVTGAAGVPLTPERSLAVDPSFLPYGTPVFVATTLADGSLFTRLMVAEDTGTAIRGPLRGDLYFGPGDRAAWLAGHQKSTGRFVLLLPRGGGS